MQTMQMFGEFEGFPRKDSALLGVGATTPVLQIYFGEGNIEILRGVGPRLQT